jgi:hypothetical protein
VGDGPDVLAFSILVEGLHGRSLAAVRGAQVTCVNAMMRYVREAHGVRPELAPEATPSSATPDLEPGQEVSEGQEELPEPAAASPKAPAPTDTASHRQPAAPTDTAPHKQPAAPTDPALHKQPASPASQLPRFIPAAPH